MAAGSPLAASNETCGAVNLKYLGNTNPATCPDKKAALFKPAACNYTGEGPSRSYNYSLSILSLPI